MPMMLRPFRAALLGPEGLCLELLLYIVSNQSYIYRVCSSLPPQLDIRLASSAHEIINSQASTSETLSSYNEHKSLFLVSANQPFHGR
jgi:hypothetical protein